MTDHTETALSLLYRHGLPEDVIDGALALHAQELAAAQRAAHGERRPYFHMGLPCTPGFGCHVGEVIDLIDPTRTGNQAAVSAGQPATDRTALRDRIAETLAAVLAECDAIEADYRDQHDEVAVGTRAAIIRIRARVAVLEHQPAVLPAPADRAAVLLAAVDRIGSMPEASAPPLAIRDALLHALDFSYCQGLGYSTPEELLAAYDASQAVLPAPTDRAVVLREAADAIAALDPAEAALAGQHAWGDASALLRRLAGEAAVPDTTSNGAQDDINSGPGWYEVISPRNATTCIVLVYEDGSLYLPEGDDLDETEFAFAAARGNAHRLVRADDLPAAVSQPGKEA